MGNNPFLPARYTLLAYRGPTKPRLEAQRAAPPRQAWQEDRWRYRRKVYPVGPTAIVLKITNIPSRRACRAKWLRASRKGPVLTGPDARAATTL